MCECVGVWCKEDTKQWYVQEGGRGESVVDEAEAERRRLLFKAVIQEQKAQARKKSEYSERVGRERKGEIERSE